MVRILHNFLIIVFAKRKIAFGAVSAKASDKVDISISAGDFNSVVTFVKAAGLVENLKGEGPFMVFASTGEAFAILSGSTVEALLNPGNKEQLVGLLTCQTVIGKIISGNIGGQMAGVKTIQGSMLSIVTTVGERVDQATVVSADIEASIGFFHFINTVVSPQYRLKQSIFNKNLHG